MTLEGAKNRDAILRALIETRSFTNISLSQTELVSKTHIENKYLISYLDLLRQNKHVEITSDHAKSDRTWHATHLGIIFIKEEGGYEGFFVSEQRKASHDAILEKEMRVNNIWMRRATIGAAAFSGLYLCWTIWAYFHSCPCCN